MNELFIKNNLEINKKYGIDLSLKSADEKLITDGTFFIANDRKYMLQSSVDMAHAIDCWVEQFGQMTYNHIFFLFGFGNPGYIRKLMEKSPEIHLYIYVPDDMLLQNIMSNFDISDIITNKRIYICLGENRKEMLREVCAIVINNITRKFLEIGRLPNMETAYSEELSYFMKTIKNKIYYALFSDGTTIKDEASRFKSYLNTVNKLKDEFLYADLRRKLHNINPDGLAIVVGAGPSLAKNINLLKRVKNRAFIICVDSAINAMLSNDIVPDLLACVDPEKNPESFKNERIWQVPLVIEAYGNYQVFNAHKGKKIIFSNSSGYINLNGEKIGKTIMGIEVGGTVTHAALSIAYNAGFKNIALIGQDLGYPGGKTHYDKDGLVTKYEIGEGNNFFYVDDIYGGKILTETNMDFYRRWFEEWCVLHPEVNLIDATEGGAKIEGTTIMTLQDCIDKYSGETKIDYLNLVNEIEPAFSLDERIEYIKLIKEDYASIDEKIKKIKDGKKLYKDMLELYKNGQAGDDNYRNILKELGEFNNWLESDRVLKLFNLFNNRENVAANQILGQHAASEEEEVELTVESGLHIIDGYISAGEKLKKEWKIDEL